MQTRTTEAELCPEWGHPILTPEGREIRIPNVFERLKQLGLIRRDRETGLYRLVAAVYEFMNSDYDSLMGPLRRILGVDLSGPEWLDCRCSECRQKQQDTDKTRLPWRMVNRPDVVAALQKEQQRRFSRRAPREVQR